MLVWLVVLVAKVGAAVALRRCALLLRCGRLSPLGPLGTDHLLNDGGLPEVPRCECFRCELRDELLALEQGIDGAHQLDGFDDQRRCAPNLLEARPVESMRVRPLIIPPKLYVLGQVRVLPELVDGRLRCLQRLLHLGVCRLHHQMLVHRLVEYSIGLVVYAVHWVVRDEVEGQEGAAAQLLRQVALRVELQGLRHVPLIQRVELRVDLVEGRAPPIVGAKGLLATRALEVPEPGFLLAERLPGWAVRPMAQIGERRAAIVRLGALGEIVQGGPVGLVAALAEGRAESVGVILRSGRAVASQIPKFENWIQNESSVFGAARSGLI